MKHIGIIAEYNPFHNGHYYQLHTVKNLFPEKKIIIMMSGDFVQRGEPAIFNKYLRTKCALLSGADIVFELPSIFAASSAEHFATTSVLALAKTGVIDTLCFGAENDDLDSFIKIAELLSDEPNQYQIILKEHLKSGLSYPKARALAIGTYCHNTTYEDLLSQPNNILGIEYIKAIFKYHLDLKPMIIKRKGNDYHNPDLNNPLSSATALRNAICKNNFGILSSELKTFIPETAFKELSGSIFAKPLFLSDFYTFLQYALWENHASYEDYFEIPRELSDKISSFRIYPTDIYEFLLQLAGKNFTNTRIKRALLNILFKQTKQNMSELRNREYLSYLRILGFHSEASSVLKEMKEKSRLPLINKMADADRILSSQAFIEFQKNIHISNLYKQAFFNKYGISMPSEYEQSVIIQK